MSAEVTGPLGNRTVAGPIILPGTLRERLEFAGLVVVLTALTTGPVYVVAVRLLSAPGTWEDGWIKYAFITCAGVGSLVWLSVALDGRLRSPDPAILIAGAYTALAVASTYWSILPYFTLWRSLTYAGLLATAWAVASLSYGTLIALLVSIGGIGTGLSMLMVFAYPDVGRDGAGSWRGIYTNPNSLGPVAALLVIALLAIAFESDSHRSRVAAGAVAAVALVPLLGSGSTTAVLSLVAAVAIASLIYALARLDAGLLLVCTVLALTAGVAVLGVFLAERLGLLDSLTQRREVWSIVWDRIWIKPVGGYGFFTYWDTAASMSPRILARAGSAHNSALDAALGVGFGGLFLVTALALLALVRAVLAAVKEASAMNWTWLTLTVFVILTHVTESFASWFSYMWILLIVVACGPRIDPRR